MAEKTRRVAISVLLVVVLVAIVAWQVYGKSHSVLLEIPVIVLGLYIATAVLRVQLFGGIYNKMKSHVGWVVGLALVAVVVALGVFAMKDRSTRETYIRNGDLDDIIAELYTVSPVVKDLNFYEGDKSYTINKKNVYICMKDENGEYYDRNFLIFVILHEISHALCDEIGHTDKFMHIFQQVLERAAQLGVYDPDGKKIVNYCNYRK